MPRLLPTALALIALAAPAFAQGTGSAPSGASAPAGGSAPTGGGAPAGAEPYGPEVLLAKEDSVPVRTDPGFVYREIKDAWVNVERLLADNLSLLHLEIHAIDDGLRAVALDDVFEFKLSHAVDYNSPSQACAQPIIPPC